MSILDGVHSESCPFENVFIRDCVHSEKCPFGLVFKQDGVHSRWDPFGIVSIRICVHSEWCPFGIMSIRDGVHSELCLLGMVSFCDVPIGDPVYSEWCPFGLLPFGKVSIRDCSIRDGVRSGYVHSRWCSFRLCPFGMVSIRPNTTCADMHSVRLHRWQGYCNMYYTQITDKTQKHSELHNIRNTLRLNGFPTRTTFLTSSRQQSHNT